MTQSLAAARELLHSGHLRAAGSVAGVLIQRHLATVTDDRGLRPTKRNPGIADYNDQLRNGGVIDQPTWRRIQLLGDIRNICSHNKKMDPTSEQVRDLLDGTDWVIATVGN